MSYHFTPARLAIISKTIIGKDMEKLDILYPAGGNAKQCGCFGKQNGSSLKS